MNIVKQIRIISVMEIK